MAVTLLAGLPVAADDSYAALGRARGAASKPLLTERYAPGEVRYGELRVPKGKGPFPVVVLIHGGCWLASMENVTGIAPMADALTQRGFATWTIEYRRLGDAGGGWPGTFEDVGAGVDYLRVLARKAPLDLSRVSLVGHSSGAHLALWAASRGKLQSPVAGKAPLKIAAVGALDGPGDLAAFVGPDVKVCNQPVVVPLMGGTPQQKPAEYRLASPAAHLPLGVRQLFVEADLAKAMEGYVAASKASGDPVAVLKPAGADHFNILTPGTPQGEAVANYLATTLTPKR